jgi:mono/diheme cytochrome c family protein
MDDVFAFKMRTPGLVARGRSRSAAMKLACGPVLFTCLNLIPHAVAAEPASTAVTTSAEVRFEREVKPILAHHCFKCHSQGKDKGGFSMASRETLLKGGDSGAVVEVGRSGESLLIRRVTSQDPDEMMPPPDEGVAPLSAKQAALLRAWIDQGADWPDPKVANPYRLALHPPPVPAGAGNPIDRILEPYFKQHAQPTNARIDERLFARRVFLDLLGLLPPPDELEAYVRDNAPDKRARLARRLLDEHDTFVGHWISFWSDHLRIGSAFDSAAFDHDNSAKPRQWLEAQLRSGAPYDRFAANFITGEILDQYGRSIAPKDEVASASAGPELQTAQVLAQVFLGVRLQCATCHDSFVDRWTQQEAWGLAAALGNPGEMVRCEIPSGRHATPQFIFPELGKIDAAWSVAERRKRLAELITAPQNGLFARTIVNRLWARLFGRGLVEPVDEMVEQSAWNDDLLEWLAAELVREKYDLKKILFRIVTSDAYQLPIARETGVPTAAAPYVFRGPLVRRITSEQFVDALTSLGIEPPAAGAASRITRRAWEQPNNSLMRILGRPDRNVVASTRSSEAFALQAIELMNGLEVNQLIDAAAERIFARCERKGANPVDQVFLELLGRSPSGSERGWAGTNRDTPLSKNDLADLIWAVVVLPEFQLLR